MLAERRTARPRAAPPGWSREVADVDRGRPRARASRTACWSPENVLVDNAGSVRIIGFAVDAALHGLPPGRVAADVVDLAGLLYATLTGRWAGRLAVGGAPRPARARPGAAAAAGAGRRPPGARRPLRRACSTPTPPGRERTRATSATSPPPAASATALREFVGDPAGLAAAEAIAAGNPETTETARRCPPSPPRSSRPQPRRRATDRTGPEPDRPTPDARAGARADPSRPRAEPGRRPPAPDAVPWPRTCRPRPGLPIFDDENDDVSWLAKPADEPRPRRRRSRSHRSGRCSPRTRPTAAPCGTPGRPSPPPGPVPPAYWPWDTGHQRRPATTTGSGIIEPVDEDDSTPTSVPGRSWLRLAALVAALALVLLAVVVAATTSAAAATPLGAASPTTQRTPSPSATASAHPAPTAVSTASPPPTSTRRATDPRRTPSSRRCAVDGDPRTVVADHDLQPAARPRRPQDRRRAGPRPRRPPRRSPGRPDARGPADRRLALRHRHRADRRPRPDAGRDGHGRRHRRHAITLDPARRPAATSRSGSPRSRGRRAASAGRSPR